MCFYQHLLVNVLLLLYFLIRCIVTAYWVWFKSNSITNVGNKLNCFMFPASSYLIPGIGTHIRDGDLQEYCYATFLWDNIFFLGKSSFAFFSSSWSSVFSYFPFPTSNPFIDQSLAVFGAGPQQSTITSVFIICS